MEALLNSYFHFDWLVSLGLFASVIDDELLLFSNPVVAAIDHHVDVIPQIYCYAVV